VHQGFLTNQEKLELEVKHRKEKDRRTADRIKVVLAVNSGWKFRDIAKILCLDEETVSKHFDEYVHDKKLSIQTGGSQSKLSVEQTAELLKHLDQKTYLKAADICAYVHKIYNVSYNPKSMVFWLKEHGFSYRKPDRVPAKADPKKQEEFIEEYKNFMKKMPEDEVCLFLDAVHPTMETKVSYGWIRKGEERTIETTASRTRMNIVGALNLETMGVNVQSFQTVDSESMKTFLAYLKTIYPKKRKIHIFLDRGPYNTSKETMEFAKRNGIVLHFLPPYSPNLNPIERLWKVMNEFVRNNRFFPTAKDFRRQIMLFFEKTWNEIALTMVDRINDNFCVVKKSNITV
jgi:transposase